MSRDLIQFYRAKIKQYGPWAGLRWIKKQGVSFRDAHVIHGGYPPRFRVPS